MTEYDNTNRGVLFKAKDRKSDKHPEYTGSMNVDGTDHWLSAWVNESKAGQKYFSLSIKPKSEPKAPPKSEDFDEEIPF